MNVTGLVTRYTGPLGYLFQSNAITPEPEFVITVQKDLLAGIRKVRGGPGELYVELGKGDGCIGNRDPVGTPYYLRILS